MSAVDVLRAALDMTSTALQGTVTQDSIQLLVAARAPIYAHAKSLRVGDDWSEEERVLVDQLILADRALMRRLWRPRADAFRWLRERAPEVAATMPLLAALDSDAA